MFNASDYPGFNFDYKDLEQDALPDELPFGKFLVLKGFYSATINDRDVYLPRTHRGGTPIKGYIPTDEFWEVELANGAKVYQRRKLGDPIPPIKSRGCPR